MTGLVGTRVRKKYIKMSWLVIHNAILSKKVQKFREILLHFGLWPLLFSITTSFLNVSKYIVVLSYPGPFSKVKTR